LREQLGESLSSIEKYGVPIEYITTSSLEALKFYTLATEQVNTGKTLESIPFYKKALEIDDKFSSVYMGLAVLYANTGQMKLAAETTVRAFKLRDTASENEKLRVEFFYYTFVTGEH
jgi:Tfp pilus assembly protein PilF